jgi:hypothetical protein
VIKWSALVSNVHSSFINMQRALPSCCCVEPFLPLLPVQTCLQMVGQLRQKLIECRHLQDILQDSTMRIRKQAPPAFLQVFLQVDVGVTVQRI